MITGSSRKLTMLSMMSSVADVNIVASFNPESSCCLKSLVPDFWIGTEGVGMFSGNRHKYVHVGCALAIHGQRASLKGVPDHLLLTLGECA